VVLTSGQLRTMENGGVDEGNQCENGEELQGSVLQLQRKKEHMRRGPDQATDNEWRGGELSPANGRQRRRDLSWRSEEWSRSYKNRGKRSMRSRRNSMHEELTNDGRSQWLAGGERGGSLSHDGEKWAEGGGSFGRRLLLGRGGGRRDVSTQRSPTSVKTRRRQMGLAGTQ
jgi:hypothetical protein